MQQTAWKADKLSTPANQVQQGLKGGLTWGANCTVIVSIDQYCRCGITAPGCDCQRDIRQVLVDVSQLKTQQTHQHTSCHLLLPHLLQAGGQGVIRIGAESAAVWTALNSRKR